MSQPFELRQRVRVSRGSVEVSRNPREHVHVELPARPVGMVERIMLTSPTEPDLVGCAWILLDEFLTLPGVPTLRRVLAFPHDCEEAL